MSRGIPIVNFLLILFALIVSLVCLFSGTSDSFLANDRLMTVNISQIGETPLFNTSSSNCKRGLLDDIGDDFDSALNKTTNGINCATSSIENGINSLLSSAADHLAGALNLPDFFDLHVMNYCEGNYIPRDYVKKNISSPGRNITMCSQRASNFTFNATQTVQNKLPKDVTLDDLHWPKAITDAENALKLAANVFFIFYVVSAVMTGLSMLVAIWGVFSVGKVVCLLAIVNTLIALLAWIIASAASTVLIVKASSVINDKGASIGVAATHGVSFLGLTWGATFAMLIALGLGVVRFLALKRNMAFLSGKNY